MKRLRSLLPLLFILMLVVSGCSDASSPLDPVEDAPNEAGQNQGAPNQPAVDTPEMNTDDTTAGSDNLPPDEADEQEQEANGGAAAEPPPVTLTDATWIAVGDIMMHMPQLPAYYDQSADRYDFSPFFEPIKPIIEQGDWKLANLETPIAGASLGYSGFPRFNAPTELAAALAYAGFNIVTNANNHALDRGSEGISRTLKALEAQHMVIKGTSRSQAESNQLTIVEKKGIRMGLLAYTYGTNGIPLPENMPYAVSIINEAAIIQDIKRLRDSGADFITVALHFGTEYQITPSEAQTSLARKLIAAGADIIAGSHPHVIQPYEFVEVKEQDGSIRRGLVIYSMGNFISNQRGGTKEYGLIVKVNLQKNSGTGKTVIQKVEPITTWVHRYKKNGKNRYEVMPLSSILKDKSVEGLSRTDYTSLQQDLSRVSDRLSSMADTPVSVQAAP